MENISDLPKIKSFVPEELIGHLYDTLQQLRKDYILDDFNIYIITQILNEQIRRKLIKQTNKKSDVRVVCDKQ